MKWLKMDKTPEIQVVSRKVTGIRLTETLPAHGAVKRVELMLDEPFPEGFEPVVVRSTPDNPTDERA